MDIIISIKLSLKPTKMTFLGDMISEKRIYSQLKKIALHISNHISFSLPIKYLFSYKMLDFQQLSHFPFYHMHILFQSLSNCYILLLYVVWCVCVSSCWNYVCMYVAVCLWGFTIYFKQ